MPPQAADCLALAILQQQGDLSDARVSRGGAGDTDGWADAAGCPALDERAAALAALAPAQEPPGIRLVLDGPGFNLAFDPAFNPRPADEVLGRYADPLEDWLALIWTI